MDGNAKAPHEWQHRFHALDSEPAAIMPGGDLVRLWASRRGDRLLPAWSRFAMDDFRPWLGLVSIDTVSHEPFDCTVRLWGTRLTELYGFEATGRSLRRDYDLRGMTPGDFRFWEQVALTPCIGVGSGSVDWQDREHVRVTRVFVPFGEDGQTTDTILAVAWPDSPVV